MKKFMGVTKPKIGLRGSSFQTVLKEIKFAVENKFDYFEIGGIESDFNLNSKTIREIRKISEGAKINLRLHLPYFLSISSSIPEISKAALKFAKKEIILAKKLGVKWVTIHSGRVEVRWRKEIISKQKGILIKNLKELVNFAKKLGIEINLENSWQEAICIKANEISKIAKSVPGLKIVFDIGHANAAGLNPVEFFRKTKKYLSAIHIHDNNGKSDQHALIGKGNINFKKFFKECKYSNFYGPFIIEIFPYKVALEGRKKLLELWNQI
jgi:sugar phosphate isomerase/epimerase